MKTLMFCVLLKQQRQHIVRILTLFFSTLMILAVFGTRTPVFGQTEVNIILLHHSTGGNLYYEGGVEAWFANYNSTHGTNYQITDNGRPQSQSRLKPAAEFQRTLQRPSALRLAIDRQETGYASLYLKLYLPRLTASGGQVFSAIT